MTDIINHITGVCGELHFNMKSLFIIILTIYIFNFIKYKWTNRTP